MHLKNFSLINMPGIGYTLAPAYDMVATALVNSADNEELALTLNGRKRKITRNDFVAAFTAAKIDAKAQENIFKKFEKAIPMWMEFVDFSFLNEELKNQFKELVKRKIELLRN